MFLLVLSLAAAPGAEPVTSHESGNALYKAMLDPGLSVGPDVRVKLPAPSMPDGLDAAKQKQVITTLIGSDYSYEEFSRKSVVAPNLLKIGDAKGADAVRTVDAYFVTHGDFAALDDPKFLDRLMNVGKGDGKGRGVTREELTKRKIAWTAEDEKREGYGHIEFDFLEKVRLKVTGHAMWSKTAESVVAAAEIDPRFRGDAELGNEWRSINKAGGAAAIGPVQPYGGAGFYLKITKLAGQEGALFVEQHIVFSEPAGWFDGANLLRSKLPIVVQSNVRNMRKEFAKGK